MKKIRQYEISKKAKISPSMLSEILNKKAKPSWNTAKRLAEATGSDPVDWMESPPETLRQIIERMNSTQSQ